MTMDNDERIKRWRQTRSAGRPAMESPMSDPLVDTPFRPRSDQRADVGERPPVALPDDAALEDARQAILERRRMRWRRLVRRIGIFLAAPALAVLLYMGLAATKLYQAEAVFTVETGKDSAPAANAGLFAVGGASSTVADAFKAREFILSRPMMEQMEQRFGLLTHFDTYRMDPLTRLNSPLGLNRDEYAYYLRRVRVAVDVQEGLLRLYVQARTPEDAVRFGNGILRAAEAHVNAFSDKISADQIASLTQDVQSAERQVAETRRGLAAVQARRGELSPEQSATAVYQLISQLELQLAEAQRERNALVDQGLTESPLLPRLDARVSELRAQVAEQRRRLVNPGGGSLVTALNEFEGASAKKEIAQARWQSTLNILQEAYLRILEQRRYFVLVVATSANSVPKVRDLGAIAVPILFLLGLIYAAILAVRRIGGLRSLRWSEVRDRWRYR